MDDAHGREPQPSRFLQIGLYRVLDIPRRERVQVEDIANRDLDRLVILHLKRRRRPAARLLRRRTLDKRRPSRWRARQIQLCRRINQRPVQYHFHRRSPRQHRIRSPAGQNTNQTTRRSSSQADHASGADVSRSRADPCSYGRAFRRGVHYRPGVARFIARSFDLAVFAIQRAAVRRIHRPQIDRKLRVTPFGSVNESKRTSNSPLPFTRPGRRTSVTVPVTQLPCGTRILPLAITGNAVSR